MSSLVVSEVSTFYGRIRALDAVSLEVGEGEIVALIGANGAGKTTLLKTISGVMRPRTGEVTFDGQPITRVAAERIVARGISHVPENRQLFSTMTVDENLILGAYRRYRKVGKATVEADAEKLFGIFPILSERRNQLAGTLSGGQQQMLAIARGLMADPKLVLLDEPSLGLAPLIVKELFEVIRGLRDGGVTVLLVEQNAHAALKLASRGYLMEVGKVVLEGAADDLLKDDRVHAAYLGGAAGE